MSPTRKTKPPDKGAPSEHKPSRKVALEEVMRSLQDLVSNELAIEPEKVPIETPSDAPKAIKPGQKAQPEPAAQQSAAAQRPAHDSTMAYPATSVDAGTQDNSTPLHSPVEIDSAIHLPDLSDDSGAGMAGSPAQSGPVATAGGVQQELPYLEDLPPIPAASAPAPAAEESQPQLDEIRLDELRSDEQPLPVVNTEEAAELSLLDDLPPTPPATTTTLPTATEPVWDDFPVLEEAVELAEDFGTDATGPHSETLPSGLPPADVARRLAIQVAARLNVELRKSGQAGLSSDIITRLARLLQEALAKGTPNMENTMVNKASLTDGGSAGNAGAVFRPPTDKH